MELEADHQHGYNAEEYTDIRELKALASLIGPYGIKQLNDSLMQAIHASMTEIKRIVTENKTELDIIRQKTHQAEQCANAFARLRGMEAFIDHIKLVGSVLSFRRMLAEQSKDVLRQKIPYIFNSVADWHASSGQSVKAMNALAFAAGIESKVDPFLLGTLESLCKNPEADYSIWSLFMTMSANALKALAYDPTTVFNPAYDAHQNNAHVIATAMDEVRSHQHPQPAFLMHPGTGCS